MKVIGLTGGIGSGKSFVAHVAEKYFKILHISTDEIARRQMLKGGVSYKRVIEEFSGYISGLIREDGEIDRQVLSKLVLNDRNMLEKLDGITHPAVIDEVNRMIEEEKEAGIYDAVLIETALIYEAGMDVICDEVWYVYAPLETRRKRLSESRSYSDEKIDGFFNGQLSEEEFLRRSTRTVPNGDDVTEEDMIRIIRGYL